MMPLTLWRIDIFCFQLGVKCRTFAMPCLVMVTNMSGHRKEGTTRANHGITKRAWMRCDGTQCRLNFVKNVKSALSKQDIPSLKLHAVIWAQCFVLFTCTVSEEREENCQIGTLTWNPSASIQFLCCVAKLFSIVFTIYSRDCCHWLDSVCNFTACGGQWASAESIL